jgi:hypothetical protein
VGAPTLKQPRVRIQEYQFSLIWCRTVPEQWRYRPQAPHKYLSNELDYVAAFRMLAEVDSESGKPGVPWQPGERFWERYTTQSAKRARAEMAWRWSLPMFIHSPLKLKAQGKGYCYTGRYLYPHGVALLMHFRQRCDLPLQEVATTAREIRYARFAMNGRNMALDRIAAWDLDRYGAYVWGNDCRLSGDGAEPFSVFTVIRATGTEWAHPVKERGELHQFLDQVTGWYDRRRDPGKLESSRVSTPREDGHILYGHRRSRCVWFPEHFATGDVRYSLSHYHRNLTLCSMQTESLGQYVCRLAANLDEPGYLTIPQKEYARHVIRSVDRLKGGRPEETYRSRSPLHQMERNDVLPSVDRVRAYLATQ